MMQDVWLKTDLLTFSLEMSWLNFQSRSDETECFLLGKKTAVDQLGKAVKVHFAATIRGLAERKPRHYLYTILTNYHLYLYLYI